MILYRTRSAGRSGRALVCGVPLFENQLYGCVAIHAHVIEFDYIDYKTVCNASAHSQESIAVFINCYIHMTMKYLVLNSDSGQCFTLFQLPFIFLVKNTINKHHDDNTMHV